MVMHNPLKRFIEFIKTPGHSRTISTLVILIISAAVPLTVLVAQQQQQTQQRAVTNNCGSGTNTWYCAASVCSNCTFNKQICGTTTGSCITTLSYKSNTCSPASNPYQCVPTPAPSVVPTASANPNPTSSTAPTSTPNLTAIVCSDGHTCSVSRCVAKSCEVTANGTSTCVSGSWFANGRCGTTGCFYDAVNQRPGTCGNPTPSPIPTTSGNPSPTPIPTSVACTNSRTGASFGCSASRCISSAATCTDPNCLVGKYFGPGSCGATSCQYGPGTLIIGKCNYECPTNGAKQCSATGVPQTCTNNKWVNGTACTGELVCSNGTCTTPQQTYACANNACVAQAGGTFTENTCGGTCNATVPDCNATPQTTSACVATTSNTCSANNGTQTAQYTTYNGSTVCNPVNITQTCTVSSCNVGNICTNGTCIAQATPTPTPTPNPSGSPTPTPTPIPGHTMLAFSVGMDAIGSAGDNVNPNPSSSNQTPGHTTRNLAVQIYDSNNSQVFAQVGSINYNSGQGIFTGTVDLGANFANGNYTVKVKSDGHLKKLIPGIQNISSALTQPIQMLRVNLVAGDVDSNNALNINDYNILLSCVTSPYIANIDNHALCNTNSSYIQLSDLEDNGVVNEFDYNLFLREYAVQSGD